MEKVGKVFSLLGEVGVLNEKGAFERNRGETR